MKRSSYPKTFKPTQEMLSVTRALVQAMAWEKTIRPIVEQYQKDILAKHQFRIARHWVESGCDDVVILNPNNSYELEDDDFLVYDSECKQAALDAKLYVSNPEHCPLLVAQHNITKAQWALCDVMEPITHISRDQVTTNLDLYHQYIEINLKLLVPYIA